MFLLTVVALWLPLASASETAGKAITVTGKVLIRNDKEDASKARAMRVGESVRKDDVINTASDSSVKILFTDKTIMDIGSSSLFKISEYQLKSGSDRNVGFQMDYGKVRSAVNTPVGDKGKFMIRTKTTTMGVRGTEFVVASDFTNATPPSGTANPGRSAGSSLQVSTEITVIKGKVEVRDPTASPRAKPIALTQGQQLATKVSLVGDKIVPPAAGLAAATAAPKVTQLNQTQLNTLVAETKIADQTFNNAVTLDSSNKERSENGPKPAENGPKSPPPQNNTLAAIQEAVKNDNAAAPPPMVMPMVPGGLQNGPQLPPILPNTQGGLVKVRVVFRR